MQARNRATDENTVKQDIATIIRLTKLTETSLIITWISEHHGVLTTVAKGARRPKSPFYAKLDLFYTLEMCWSESKHSALHTLKEITLISIREKLRLSYKNTELAAYFAVLLDLCVEECNVSEGFHDLFCRALNYSCSEPGSLKALEHFEKELVKLLGIHHPSLSPHSSLETHIGTLPKNRDRCVTLLR
jgi:DNA repair protein RecO (recombination protein O)